MREHVAQARLLMDELTTADIAGVKRQLNWPETRR
jgi:hypothetical protein